MHLQCVNGTSELGEHDGLCHALIIEPAQLIERGQDQRLESIEQLVNVTHEEPPSWLTLRRLDDIDKHFSKIERVTVNDI
jgi:hypothetical protein